MASCSSNKHLLYLSAIFMINICYLELVLGINPRNLTLSMGSKHWFSAGATWYGSPNGAGSDGGACGYGDAVSKPPFSSLIAGIGPSLYDSGKECGACYLVKCTNRKSCSGKPVRVVITDFCPGGPCTEGLAHFDLSGTAFGAMALLGQEDDLRNAGVLTIRYARVACEYSGKTIVFHVDPGSNPNYISVVVEYEGGDGDLSAVYLKESDESHEWRQMQQSWGAVWKLDAGSELKPPLSFQLTSGYSGETVVAKNVIPSGWKPGATYISLVNF